MRYCPECVKILDKDYDICPICGYNEPSQSVCNYDDWESGSPFDILDDMELIYGPIDYDYSMEEKQVHKCQNEIIDNKAKNNADDKAEKAKNDNNKKTRKSKSDMPVEDLAQRAMKKNNSIKIKNNSIAASGKANTETPNSQQNKVSQQNRQLFSNLYKTDIPLEIVNKQ